MKYSADVAAVATFLSRYLSVGDAIAGMIVRRRAVRIVVYCMIASMLSVQKAVLK